MTELLQQALKKLSDLPIDKKETIARLINTPRNRTRGSEN